MYLEKSGGQRSNWKYTYLGKELERAAKRLRDGFKEEESQCREKMSALLKDSKVSVSSGEVTKLQDRIERAARDAEECAVFAHEFEQRLNAEFLLSSGDVVFFGFPERK
jgi:hypothetical protein